jgi:galactoside O-acetyltransferase
VSYLSSEALKSIGFKSLGKNVKVSNLVSIHRPEEISIGDNSRIDDFSAISGKITIGENVHIAVHCTLLASGEPLIMEDFSNYFDSCQQSNDFIA